MVKQQTLFNKTTTATTTTLRFGKSGFPLQYPGVKRVLKLC